MCFCYIAVKKLNLSQRLNFFFLHCVERKVNNNYCDLKIIILFLHFFALNIDFMTNNVSTLIFISLVLFIFSYMRDFITTGLMWK